MGWLLKIDGQGWGRLPLGCLYSSGTPQEPFLQAVRWTSLLGFFPAGSASREMCGVKEVMPLLPFYC